MSARAWHVATVTWPGSTTVQAAMLSNARASTTWAELILLRVNTMVASRPRIFVVTAAVSATASSLGGGKRTSTASNGPEVGAAVL
eukprot:7975281-Alexandrium_andersonii.AAC.1